MYKHLPTFEYETPLWNKKYLVIGIDEVGRGALAGPVGVGAVCFDPGNLKTAEDLGINDSKKLSAEKRVKLCMEMNSIVLAYSVQYSSVSFINSKGIVHAVNTAIRKAVADIQKQLNTSLSLYLLLDAFNVPYIRGIGLKSQTSIIKGDEMSISIASASIFAKVKRDSVMSDLSKKYKAYNWAQNKGYGTKVHLEAIKSHGSTSQHRKLYIRNVLNTIL